MAQNIDVNNVVTALNQVAQGAGIAAENIKRERDAKAEMAALNSRLKTSMENLARASFSTEQGMSKYGTAVRSATDAIGNFAASFNIVGKGLGLLVKAIGAVTSDVLKQNDAYLKAKDSLNQFGFSSSMTAAEIGKMGRNAGYTADELEKYTGAITSMGTDMISLGKTFGQGTKIFGQMTANSLDVIAEFGRMGISQEQLTKSQAHYVKLLSVQGIQITDQMKTGDTLNKNSRAYTENLLTLAALSGEDIENIKRKQEAARADLNFSIGQAMKAKEAAELESRVGDSEAKTRAERLRKEIKANEEMQNIAMVMGLSGQELSSFNQMLQTGTFTDLSAKFAPFGSDLLSFIKDVQAGHKDASGLAIQLARMTDRALDAVGTAATLNASEITNVIQLNSEQIKRAAQLRGMSEEQYVKMVKEEVEKRKKANAMGTDPLADARSRQQIMEKALKLAYEQFTEMVRGPLMQAIEMLQKALMWLGRGVLHAAKFLGKITGTDEKAFDKLLIAMTPIESLQEDLKTKKEKLGASGFSDKELEVLKKEETIKAQIAAIEEERLKLQEKQRTSTGEDKANIITAISKLDIQKAALERDNQRLTGNVAGNDLKRKQEERKQLQEQIQELERAIREKERQGLGGALGSTASSIGAYTGAVSRQGYTAEQLREQFKKVRKTGDVQRDGAEVDSRIIHLAKFLDQLDFVDRITGFNDKYERGVNSVHKAGRAIDFVLKEGSYSEELIDDLRKQVTRMVPGAKLLDEYKNPSDHSNGKHIHIEVPGARFGRMPSMINASTSGQLMEVHNNELIAPLDPNSIIAKLLTATPSEADSILGGRMDNDVASTMSSGISEMLVRMGDMVDKLSTLNSTQEEILMYTRTG